MQRTNVQLKLAAVLILFAVVLLVSVRMVYDNTQTLITANRRNAAFISRRALADSLVYSLLEANSAERSLCLGITSEWNAFDHALKRASAVAEALKAATAEQRQQARIDTLITLLSLKRSNMNSLLELTDRDPRDKFYADKVRSLRSGRDSVVIHPRVNNAAASHETVYEVEKTKRTFLARLADAFRKQRSDTIRTTRRLGSAAADTVHNGINIADTVAHALAEIHDEESQRHRSRAQRLAGSDRRLQLLSVETAVRAQQLLRDISEDERLSLSKSMAKGQQTRQSLIAKIIVLAAVAVLSALVLIIFVARDIRRQRTYSRNMELAKAETERLMQQRERLLLTITHDIKAPAASISGFIELLEDHVHDAKGRSCLSNIRSSARHLLSLVSSLLDYQRLESGKAEPHISSFSPAKLVESSVSSCRPQAERRGLKLLCSVDSGSKALCRADAFRIRQALDNLLGNAIKFTRQGAVTVTAASNGRKLTLTVADTGCGMTEEETRRAFNAFTRLPSAEGTEGAGLGLSIVREAVKLLRGEVSVSSVKGQGSVFTLTIPVERTADTASGEQGAQSRRTPTVAQGAVKAIALDDDRLQLQLLKEMFSRLHGAQFSLRTSRHAAEALSMAARERPDVMLIDMEMPEMSGADFLKKLDLRSATAIAMTAHEADIEPQILAAGFDACLFKPFSGADLAAAFSAATGRGVSYKPLSPTPCADRFAALTAFADGDHEAERQILSDFRASLAEAEATLRTAIQPQTAGGKPSPDRAAISQTAHKLAPSLCLADPIDAEKLGSLTAESISTLDGEAVIEFTSSLVDSIRSIISELDSRLRPQPSEC